MTFPAEKANGPSEAEEDQQPLSGGRERDGQDQDGGETSPGRSTDNITNSTVGGSLFYF